MTFRQSMKNRIKIAFCGFGIILAIFYWLLLDISVNLAEDMIFENRLKNEIAAFLDRYGENPDAVPPHSAYIQSYIGPYRMPKALRETVAGLAEGFYETEGPTAIKGPEDFHIGVKQVPGSKEFFYIFFDVGTLKVAERFEAIFRTFLFVSTIAFALIGGGIGGFLAKKVIAPVTQLADQVAAASPDNLSVDLSGRFADDEVGLLARTLETHMQRIQAFIEREKTFTRDTSHELRTPITVIQGAAELISRLPAGRDPRVQRPLKRIERSAKGMGNTVETFLWLAREVPAGPCDQTCDITGEARKIFQEQAALFKKKPVRPEFRAEHTPEIRAEPAVFRIIMNNLIANAFHYTAKGRITLTVYTDKLEIFNSGELKLPATTRSLLEPNVRGEQSRGFGFGLAIVKRLCERYGWHLDIRDQENKNTRDGKGTLVCLKFKRRTHG